MDIQRIPISPELRNALAQHAYDVIASIHEAHTDLGPGMPEYLYQEALTTSLTEHGYLPEKEYQHHPLYHGKRMESFLKMDVMVPKPQGVMGSPTDASEAISVGESGGTGRFNGCVTAGPRDPVAEREGTWPKAQIERYYYNKKEKTIRAF